MNDLSTKAILLTGVALGIAVSLGVGMLRELAHRAFAALAELGAKRQREERGATGARFGASRDTCSALLGSDRCERPQRHKGLHRNLDEEEIVILWGSEQEELETLTSMMVPACGLPCDGGELCVLENRHAGPCRSFAIPPGAVGSK